MKTHNRFAKGSGCFSCRCCGKKTRNTGDNGGCGLCPLCFEISSCENTLSDNGWGTFGDLAHCKTIDEVYEEVDRREQAAKARVS